MLTKDAKVTGYIFKYTIQKQKDAVQRMRKNEFPHCLRLVLNK